MNRRNFIRGIVIVGTSAFLPKISINQVFPATNLEMALNRFNVAGLNVIRASYKLALAFAKVSVDYDALVTQLEVIRD